MVLTSALIFFYFRDTMNAILDWGEYQGQVGQGYVNSYHCLFCTTCAFLLSSPLMLK